VELTEKVTDVLAQILVPCDDMIFKDAGKDGLTLIEKFWPGPLHPFAAAVTVNADTTCELPEFVAVNADILPLPAAARPMEVLLFVQV